ncbi:hypothetical protein K488DRAFT_45106 [Vararia minispora EC-137]|uniref:Uncharacterized protein n=1 Tax=Vararia minispora EC-137 TaxID=1314806 RepID=A0ACB8QS21_9AGAM|nr:hypothetical protein K488DRAFT_45106 [Vararia minispora EC-137]
MADLDVVVPDGFVSTAIVTHQLNIILIVAPLGAMLIPIVCTLFAFTPSTIRRRPVFLLNVFACILGIAQAVITVVLNYQILASPSEPFTVATYLFKIATLLVPPVFVDTIVMFRFLAFFPIQLTARRTLLGVLFFPVACKVARLILIAVFLGTYPAGRLAGPRSLAVENLIWGQGPIVAAIFGMQALDNAYVHYLCLERSSSHSLRPSYASSIFLYKLYKFRKNGINVRGSCLTRFP